MDEKLKQLVANWLVKAGNDVKSMDTLLASDELITDSICYHAQQAAEKYLKLYIVSNNISPDKTHKIELLIKKCAEIDSDFLCLKEAVLLSEYGIELRYPDNFYIPTHDEAREAYRLAIFVRDFVLSKIKL